MTVRDGSAQGPPPGFPSCAELVDLITDYLEGALPAPELARFEEHLAACVGCRAYLDQMRASVAATGRLTEESLDAEARDALLGAFRGWQAGRSAEESHAVDVRTEAVIRRPREEVAAFVQDPSNAPRWYANIRSVEWRTPPPLAVGSRLAFEAQFLGRRLVYTYEIAEFAPGERLVMRTAQGPFPMETTYMWEDAAGGHTRMTLCNRGTPSGFSRRVAPFMARAVRRANRKDLAALTALLEGA